MAVRIRGMTASAALHRWLLTYGIGVAGAIALVVAITLLAIVLLKRRRRP